MKNAVLVVIAVVAVVIGFLTLQTDMDGLAKFGIIMLCWLALSVAGSLLLGKLFRKHGH